MILPVITTSERTSFRRCPQQWFWRYRMGLVPRGETVDALWFGIGVHEALAHWYQPGLKRGRHPAAYFDEWCGDEEREIRASFSERDKEWYDEPKFEDARELGIAMLEQYVDRYGKDEHWDVIATEQQFKVRVIYRGQPIGEFWSTFDGVYRDLADGRIKLMEHKTAAQFSFAYLDLDDQGGSYWAVAGAVLRAKGILKPNEQIKEITYNFLRKSMPDERPRNEKGESLNQNGTVSKKQPAIAFARPPVERTPAQNQIQMERLAKEVHNMQAMRSGEMEITKSTTKDCPWCPFFQMCIAHERGGDGWEELMRADFIQRNPYERYEKSA
jgi:hypothetical protein